jgi:hypothetical protein
VAVAIFGNFSEFFYAFYSFFFRKGNFQQSDLGGELLPF